MRRGLHARLTRLEARLRSIPVTPDPAKEAEKQYRCLRAIDAYLSGHILPPDLDEQTLSFWKTVVEYSEAIEEAVRSGIFERIDPKEAEVWADARKKPRKLQPSPSRG